MEESLEDYIRISKNTKDKEKELSSKVRFVDFYLRHT